MTSVDTATNQEELLARASELAGLARELGLSAVAERIEADARRRLERGRLRVVVVGEIKHGKTSLINALLGRDDLPTGVTPTTLAVVEVRIGGRAGRYRRTPDGEREPVDHKYFDELIGGRGEEPAEGLELVCAQAELPPEIELVDTPGINDLGRFREATSRGEFGRADVLVVVFDATQLLNRTELALIRDALVAMGGIDATGASLLPIINRIDLVDEQDRSVLRDHLGRQLAGLPGADRGQGAPLIFETDARTAVREPGSETHGVREVGRLREHLRTLAARRDVILPARARAGLLSQVALLSHNAAIQSRALTLEAEVLARELADVEASIEGQRHDLEELRTLLRSGRERVLADSDRRLARFGRQIEASALAYVDSASLRSLTSHLSGALHEAFISFARDEGEQVRAALEDLTRQALRTHGEQAKRRLFRALLVLGFDGPVEYLQPPPVALEAGLVAVGVLGTAVMYFGNLVAGLIMTVAGPLATVALHERSLRGARTRARELVPPAVARASQQMTEAIGRVVDDHVAGLEEHLVLASAALGEQLVRVLRRAQGELEAGTDDTDLGTRRKRAREHTASIERRLAELRAQLETPPGV